MGDWKIRDITAVGVATLEGMVVEYLDPQIQRIATIGLCGLTAILIIALWPEEVEEEIWISPQQQELEEMAKRMQKTITAPISLEKMGYVRRKVKRKKWLGSEWLEKKKRWNSETCEWEWDFE